MLWSQGPGFCSKATNQEWFSVLASLIEVLHWVWGDDGESRN